MHCIMLLGGGVAGASLLGAALALCAVLSMYMPGAWERALNQQHRPASVHANEVAARNDRESAGRLESLPQVEMGI